MKRDSSEVLVWAVVDHCLLKLITRHPFEEEVPQAKVIEVLDDHYRQFWGWRGQRSELEEALVGEGHRREKEASTAGWSELSWDELSTVFSLLSWAECLRVSMVCKRWRKAAWRHRIRCFRTPLLFQTGLAPLERAEMIQFVEDHRIVHFARCGVHDFLSQPWLWERTNSVKLDLKTLGSAEDLQKVFSLPNIRELTLIFQTHNKLNHFYHTALNRWGHQMVHLERLELIREGTRQFAGTTASVPFIPPSVTQLVLEDGARDVLALFGSDARSLPSGLVTLKVEIRFPIKTPSNTDSGFQARLAKLKVLELLTPDRFDDSDLVPEWLLQEILMSFPALQSLTGPIGLNRCLGEFPLRSLHLVQTLKKEERGPENVFAQMEGSLQTLSLRATVSTLRSLPFGRSLKHLTCTIIRSSALPAAWGEFWDHLVELVNLESLRLSIEGGPVSVSAIRLPERLVFLQFEDFNVVPWAAISMLDRLRVLRLLSCEPPLTGQFTQYLPRHLRELVMIGTHCWPPMTLKDWIVLPPLLQNSPTVESALDGIIQFL